jgi:hypothetical protein
MRRFGRTAIVGLVILSMAVNSTLACHFFRRRCCAPCYRPCVVTCRPCESSCSTPVYGTVDSGAMPYTSEMQVTEPAEAVVETPKPALPKTETLPPPAPAKPAQPPAPAAPAVVNEEPAPAVEPPPAEPPAEEEPAPVVAEDTAPEVAPDKAAPAEKPAKPAADEVDDLFAEDPADAKAPAADEAPAEEAAPEEKPAAEGDDAVDDLFDDAGAEEKKPAEEAAPAEEPAEKAAPEEKPAEEGDDLFGDGAQLQPASSDATTEEASDYRLWTDNTGRYQVTAKLVVVLDGKVRLQKETGRFTTVSFDRLSTADLDLVLRHNKIAANARSF